LNAAIVFWGIQMVLNALWSYFFFGRHRIGAALADVTGMLLAIVGFIVTAWPISRAAAWLFVPYLAWVTFAATLNASIYLRNRGAAADKRAFPANARKG